MNLDQYLIPATESLKSLLNKIVHFKSKKKLKREQIEQLQNMNSQALAQKLVQIISPILAKDATARKQLANELKENGLDLKITNIGGYPGALAPLNVEKNTGIKDLWLVSNIRTNSKEYPYMGINMDGGALEEILLDSSYAKEYVQGIQNCEGEV